MILRLTTLHENARSALECGSEAAALSSERKVRRLTDTALQGAFGTTIFMAARNLALILFPRQSRSTSSSDLPPHRARFLAALGMTVVRETSASRRTLELSTFVPRMQLLKQPAQEIFGGLQVLVPGKNFINHALSFRP